MNHLDQLVQSALDEVGQCRALTDLDAIRVKYLGKSGLLTEKLKGISTLSVGEKKHIGKTLNDIKIQIWIIRL